MDDNLELIKTVVTRLKQLTELDIQQNWHYHAEQNNFSNLEKYLTTIDFNACSKVSLNERGYIVFPQGKQVRWLFQKIVIPNHLQQYLLSNFTLRLVLTWWADDAQIFINGKLIQQGDLFDSSARILITPKAIAQQEFLLAIRLVTPGHDIGALMRSHLLYEQPNIPQQIDPGWFSKEIAVLSKYLSKFENQKIVLLAQELSKIDWDLLPNNQAFDNCLNSIRQRLLPLAKNIKQRRFHILGHAHLDMAWLWTTTETYEVAQRTFKSVLNLQQAYSQLTFCHTSPALYQWIEANCPDLFCAIKQAVKAGKWEALGGMWIEPEVNIISGESIIRQLLYGQQYYREKFGCTSKVAWLPDSFGFPGQLPQLLKQCGIDYFVTGKLHWNDTNQFPHGCFWWESPDGTKLFTMMSPPNVTGVMDTNPLTMTDYSVQWESQTGLQDIFWLPGVGDHGGGPTRDMLDVASLWQQSPFFPEIEFTTATEYLDRISQMQSSYPIHDSELYLELHRGCYTTHGDQKRFNRDCENLLYQAELFATIATLINRDSLHSALFSHYEENIKKILESQEFNLEQEQKIKLKNTKEENKNKLDLKDSKNPSYQLSTLWQQQIETAWKKVLFNQFHDILPGTSIPEVFIEANQEWTAAIAIGKTVLNQSLRAIASLITLPKSPHTDAKPIVIFNALNWMRSQTIILSTAQKQDRVYDLENNLVETQLTADNQLLFLAKDIPAVGYKVYWLLPKKVISNSAASLIIDCQKNYILENNFLKVIINSQTGAIDSICDQVNQQEMLSAPGNQLQFFTDKGQYWDAWNIDPEYEQKQLPSAKLTSIQWLESGTIQQSIRVIKTIGQSEFIQDYILEEHSPILKIKTTVDWQETHVLVKAAFPLTIESDYATSEIACGAIKRSTKPQTAAEKAQWETSALKWVDLTDRTQNYGVSLLNNCKYGYDIKPSQIRITLLRSPVWPDPNSDKGKHHFTYAIYPHSNSWQSAKTVHHSYELNIPLQAIEIEPTNTKNYLPPRSSMISWNAENLILMALKLDRENNIIMRCHECHGNTANLLLDGDLQLQLIKETNCLEESISETVTAKIEPWKVKTFQLKLN